MEAHSMKLWHIDSSVLGENSASRQLTAAIVAREAARHPGLEVDYLDLAAAPVAHLSPAHIGAMFGHPPADAAVRADIARGQGFIDTLFAADIIVIGAPMYNFGLPTQLKAWADRVLVAGKTFKYGPDGVPFGLVPEGKTVYVASTRGGFYGAGAPAAAMEHQLSHLTAMLSFIGLKDVTVITAEGLAIPDRKAASIAAAEAEIAAHHAKAA
jgi:FMN-dependent NADH-azoreductase